MSSSARNDRSLPLATGIRVDDGYLVVSLSDGRALSVPLDWFPRLSSGTASEQSNYVLTARGSGIHWPDLDEDISVEALLACERSGESLNSLTAWLKKRER